MRAIADGGSLSSSLMVQGQAGALSLRLRSQETVVSRHPRRESPTKAARARAEARTQAEAAQAQADLAEAKVKVAKEQDAAIASRLRNPIDKMLSLWMLHPQAMPRPANRAIISRRSAW